MKTLLFPGAFQRVSNYGGYDGVELWKKGWPEHLPLAEIYIGHSAGSAFLLSHVDVARGAKFIFVNPLVKRRNFGEIAWDWMNFLVGELVDPRKVISPKYWAQDVWRVYQLLKVDFLEAVHKIPKENLVVVRGKHDHWICDRASVEILNANGIQTIEVEAGHDWNGNVAKTVEDLLVEFEKS